MKNALNFTKDNLLKIESPKTGREVYRDTKERGLILIVSYGGSKIFYLYKLIDCRPQRIKIGSFPDLSVTEAREKALELKNQIVKGINPAEEKSSRRREPTFKELFDRYINEYAKHNAKSWKNIVSQMDRQAKYLYDKKISTIKKGDILKIFNDLTNISIYAANSFLGISSPVFNKAIEWGLLEQNPVTGIKKHKQKSRDRYLVLEEIPRFFNALEEEANEKIRDYILLSLYTGARRSNVLSMRWDNISFNDKTWYIPGHNTKNGEPQLLPLVDEAMKILQERKKHSDSASEWVFPSSTSSSGHLQEPKKVWRRVLERAGLENLRLHDLRRTHGSWLSIAGANTYIISKALNHKSSQSTDVYVRLKNIDPIREFMEKSTGLMTQIRQKAAMEKA
ncbi:MAG: tyrosine-type recombinase/integrase [Pseudomonadota bacterium]